MYTITEAEFRLAAMTPTPTTLACTTTSRFLASGMICAVALYLVSRGWDFVEAGGKAVTTMGAVPEPIGQYVPEPVKA